MARERAEVVELEGHVISLEKQQASTADDFARKEDEIEEMKKKIIVRKGGEFGFFGSAAAGAR